MLAVVEPKKVNFGSASTRAHASWGSVKPKKFLKKLIKQGVTTQCHMLE
jgi:hypothetical protein